MMNCEANIYSKAYTDPFGITVAVVIFVAGAILTAWTYAKSPQAQMAEELEDNGTIEG